MRPGPPRIDVWVCAHPEAPHLDAVLAALAAAGVEPKVEVAPAGQGPAAARNGALERCEGDILALVDDDVEVSEGWFDAMAAAWSSAAAERLGCVGGPLGAAFVGVRPAWLGGDLLPALGVDAGPTRPAGGALPVPVDASERTFHAGNISFRAAALRGVGGFWPARGHPGLRDWFGEEHRAQHELARAGWHAAWHPGAYAARRIDGSAVRRRDVVLLRARSGVRSGVVGSTRRPAAARAAASAAAGVPVALARRDAAKLVERAARAAQNAGVLAAPWLAPGSLQPAATRTPFMFSVPPAAPGPLQTALPQLARRVRRMRGGAPIVLLYHRVATSSADPLALMVSPEHFAEQLEVLAARRTPMRLDEILAGEAPASAVAVTLDDGYADACNAALPAVEAAGFPMTMFVSTGHVDSGRAFWWDALFRLLRSGPADAQPLELTLDGQARVWPAHDADEREVAFRSVAAWLHAQRPEAIEAALAAIASWAHASDPYSPSPEDRPMTVDELRRLAASRLVTIGAHGRHHACLAALPHEWRAAELEESRRDLARWLGSAPTGLAYPFGVPGVDVDAATRDAARAAGYDYAVVNAPGAVSRRTDRMAVPRVAAGDLGADAFDAWLSAPTA